MVPEHKKQTKKTQPWNAIKHVRQDRSLSHLEGRFVHSKKTLTAKREEIKEKQQSGRF